MTCFITFSTYGSHLPGDARGSYDHLREGSRKFIPPNPGLEAYRRELMEQEPFLLNAEQRAVVRDAMVEVCSFRGWELFALHIRSNHVHGVVEAAVEGSRIVNPWKACGTRALRRAGLVAAEREIWAHGASVHLRSTQHAVDGAVRYVLDGQGG